ncbi:SUKH-4 family immunity protein [Streptomyces sp. NPDC032940]|uniref:SUKH-4 family immunity protein n=1 Tax=Streptomyces sp. NPDC032940 TaxID=3155366 RepID=UPI0034085E94
MSTGAQTISGEIMQTVTSGTTEVRAVPSLVTRVRLATSPEDPRRPRSTPAGAERPSLWNTTTLLSCLLLTVSHRTPPGAALPPGFPDHDFGRAHVTRFEPLDFPSALTHEPTRRFLTETGLPDEAHPFHRDADELLLPTLTEYAEEFPGHRLPAGADRLIRLGRLTDAGHVVLDGTTGAVLTWRTAEGTLHPLTSDVSALTLTLWALRRAALLEAVAGRDAA